MEISLPLSNELSSDDQRKERHTNIFLCKLWQIFVEWNGAISILVIVRQLFPRPVIQSLHGLPCNPIVQLLVTDCSILRRTVQQRKQHHQPQRDVQYSFVEVMFVSIGNLIPLSNGVSFAFQFTFLRQSFHFCNKRVENRVSDFVT